ncbi:CD209 antigen-like protein E isoform X4 [Polypterus senegalus]|uniref:CD209 antigen-like protein E isoform X4 n=1 Tax=Polypterus senegalus TaxID=55291 RepID=UPI00196606E9|nr:CD209 antigen-like protein E isoform X4 [Polypterus senegalus]
MVRTIDYQVYTEMETDPQAMEEPATWKTKGVPAKPHFPVRPLYVVLAAAALFGIVIVCLFLSKSSEMAAETRLLRAEQAKVQENYNSSAIKSMEAEIEQTQSKASDMSTQMRKLQREVSRVSLQVRLLQMGGGDKSFNLHEWETKVRNETANSNWSDLSGHQYYFSSNRLSWTSARDTCTSMSSYLAVVTTEQEQDFIISKMRERSWVGLSDLEEESVWKWTTGEPVEQSFWESGEPNNEFDEDCGEIKENGKLNDIPCNLRRRFVCEKDNAGAQ